MHIPFRDLFSLLEPRQEKTNNVVSEQVQHKPSFTRTEDCYMLEILQKAEELYYSCSENKAVRNCDTDLRLCFCILQNVAFPMNQRTRKLAEICFHDQRAMHENVENLRIEHESASLQI